MMHKNSLMDPPSINKISAGAAEISASESEYNYL